MPWLEGMFRSGVIVFVVIADCAKNAGFRCLPDFLCWFEFKQLVSCRSAGAWTDQALRFKHYHLFIDGFDGDRCTTAAIHLFRQVSIDHSRCRDGCVVATHNFENGVFNVAVGDYSAGTHDHCGYSDKVDISDSGPLTIDPGDRT